MVIQAATFQALQKLDTDRNRNISLAELQKADLNKDGQFSVDEAKKAGFAEADRAELNRRMLRKGMPATEVLFSANEMNTLKFAAPFTTLFPSLDQDNNQLVSKSELGKALGRNGMSTEEAASVTAAYKEYDALIAMNDDTQWLPQLPANKWLDKLPLHTYDERGISKNDLETFVGKGNPKVSSVMGRFSMTLYTEATPPKLFPKGIDSVRPDLVSQGELGDCYFLAAVAALAQHDKGKKAIMSMIKDLGDNRYQVTFPGKKPLTIDGPSLGERSMYSNASSDGHWLAVIEKAYAVQRNDSAWFVKYSNPYDKIGQGGMLSEGINALTTNGTDTDIILATRTETLRSKLTSALGSQKMVTAAIMKELIGDGNTDNGLPTAHAYSILAYDRKSDMITVRNPWGSTEVNDANGRTRDGKNDGTFQMPLSEFQSTFHFLTYEK